MKFTKGIIFLTAMVCLFSKMILGSAKILADEGNNVVLSFLATSISHPSLAILGIRETVTMKELLIVVILLLIVFTIVYSFWRITKIIGGELTSIVISAIIVLIGSYNGLPLKIAREVISAPNTFQSITTKGVVIVLLIVALIMLLWPVLLRFLVKTKRTDEQDADNERKRKLAMLKKIKDYKTDAELKRYGIK